MSLIGRETEVNILENLYLSDKPEFLALYGRRRVGKTYLIRQFFEGKKAIFFNATGSKNGAMHEQVAHFTDQIGKVFLSGANLQPEKNWDKTFKLLTEMAEKHVPKNKKIILFLDELPWMAGRNSRLLEALDYYWNQYWSNDKRIKLIICGSSAAWIINKIINNKGGLHNRITKRMHLVPFNLSQTKLFLDAIGVKLNQRQVLLLFMVMGGVPYYLTQIEKGLSASQIIEKLAFSQHSFLFNEFDNLFSSLFDDAEFHIQIVRLLAEHPYGLGKRNLLERMGKHAVGGSGNKKLEALEQTGFISRFKPLFNKKKNTYYRLSDEYTLFYLKWIEPIKNAAQADSLDHGNWQAMQLSPEWRTWLGYAFENVCYKHIAHIKKALDLKALALASTWRYASGKDSQQQGAQIDLLFDRRDDAITLCEIKYSEEPFVLSKSYVEVLEKKMTVFKAQTHSKKQLFMAMIVAGGLKNNFYAEKLLSGVVTLDDFFD
ncbi:MAG: ATP-binding protein [Gammaproteobacteria bacterium]|nr:ATP-binding protein [Gammaproteobacteria bacterium]